MRNIWITIKKELRAIVRDKKSLRIMLITPLMIPMIMILFSFIYNTMLEDMTEKTFSVGVNYELNEVETTITDACMLDVIVYENKEDMDNAFKAGDIVAYAVKDGTNYSVYSNPDDSYSAQGGACIAEYLQQYNTVLANQYLSGLDVDMEKVTSNIIISFEELDGNNEMADMILYMGIVYAMMSISLVAIYCVTDTIAGEKERGTLETLLTFPIKGTELIAGKYLAVAIACVLTSILSSVLVVGAVYVSCEMFPVFDGMARHINIATIFLTLLLMVSFALFISGLCIAVASFSKTYKEAQSALTPINYTTILPMIFYILNIGLDAKMSFIPIISHTMLINDIVTIGMNANTVTYMLITIGSTLVYSVILVSIIAKLYKSEKVLFSL